MSSGPFRIGIHFSSDNTITGHDPSPAFLDHDSVAPGSHSYSVEVTIPSNFRLGNYFVGSILDRLGNIAETNESNHSLSSDTRLMVGTPAAILKQGEVDQVNQAIASVQRQLRSLKRKIKKAKKQRNRRLLKRLKRKQRKLKSRNRTLVSRRSRLLLELDLTLQP